VSETAKAENILRASVCLEGIMPLQ